ncbi:hypothetical protein PGTUg99_014162 [Puccinia graminis f. sp. tritici]|uniref:Zn(2)-C6 fungal-type domain-containing protein n=1 Tax=Puccinia graminis f. sp. tritici TaxID=56615 RepID=A0A5B0M7L1_PUCGR|nr:hypothetical protein PGTUg99_014162 [Puccinia graminis f. sp. tritici]
MANSLPTADRYQLQQQQQQKESTIQFKPVDSTEQPKRVRQRTLRACDSCRKMKIKCMMNSDEPPCEACKLTSRDCKFEHVGVKREKPPSVRYSLLAMNHLILSQNRDIDIRAFF